MLSCGFEHCVCLIGGDIWTWGYGGSGCLGHGNYQSLTEPARVEGLKKKAIYLEAGGYHNGVIVKTNA